MIGHTIDGRYQIESLIGRGGMGSVYRANDFQEDREVAIKVLHLDLDLETAPSRFYREFRVLTRLNHPHIVKAYDYGSYDGNPYLVLELMPGETLQDRLKKDNLLSRRDLLQIGRQITDALAHLHARSIVHRDLKPSNLMLLPSSDLPHIKLMDFGLVRLDEHSVQLTQEGSTLGTVAYMSPEQAQGFVVDFRADLYSLGIILYEMACGRPPFVHENQATVLLQQITTPPLSPRHYNPEVDEALARFILELLHKEPDKRPGSTQLVANRLGHLLDETAVPISTPPQQVDLIPMVPLIGRDTTLANLREQWHSVRNGQGQVVLMPGPVGIGKGRILAEFKRQANISDKQFCRGRNQEHGSLPYQPFIDFLEMLVHGLSTEERQTLPPELSRLLPQIEDLPPAPTTIQQTDARLQLFTACWEAMHKVAQKKPMVLAVEEIQWANPTTLELISYLAQRIRQSPILLVFTYRANEVERGTPLDLLLQDLRRADTVHTLTIPPLTREQVGIYLRVALGRERLPNWLIDSFHLTTGGNPLFIEETLKVLAAEGQVAEWHEHDSSFWLTISQPGMRLQLPQSVLAIAERRLQTLPDQEKTILTTAAVFGPEFSFDLLQDVTKLDEEDLIDSVDWLLTARLIEELPIVDGEDRYRFTEESLRQALLNTISRRRLRLLHRRIGESIQSVYDTSRPRYWPALAYHYKEAGRYEQSMTYFTRAGDAATEMYAYAEAVSHYTSALEMTSQVEADTQRLRHLYQQRGRNMELNGQFELALSNYETMGRLARDEDDQALLLSAIMACATILATPTPVHDAERGQRLSKEGLALAQQLGDRQSEARALWNLLLSLSGPNPEEAIRYGEQSVTIARELGLKEQLAFTLNDLHWPYISRGEVDKARRAWEEAQQLWRELNNTHMLADSLTNAAGASVLSGDLEAGRSLAEEAYAVSGSIDNPWGQAYSRWPIEYYWWEKGDADKVVYFMQEAIRLARQAGLIPPQVTTLSDMAWVYAYLGDYRRGLSLAQEAQQKSEELLPWSRPYTDAFVARIQVLLGDVEMAAETLADYTAESIDNAAALGPVWILLAKAEVAVAQEDYSQAMRFLTALQQGFEHSKLILYLPDILNLKGTIWLTQQKIKKAKAAWEAARQEASNLDSRRNLWPALVGLSQIATIQQDNQRAESLRQEAIEIILYIADHAREVGLRETFLNSPPIQTILNL